MLDSVLANNFRKDDDSASSLENNALGHHPRPTTTHTKPGNDPRPTTAHTNPGPKPPGHSSKPPGPSSKPPGRKPPNNGTWSEPPHSKPLDHSSKPPGPKPPRLSYSKPPHSKPPRSKPPHSKSHYKTISYTTSTVTTTISGSTTIYVATCPVTDDYTKPKPTGDYIFFRRLFCVFFRDILFISTWLLHVLALLLALGFKASVPPQNINNRHAMATESAFLLLHHHHRLH